MLTNKDSWQKEQGTHLLDFSRGSGRKKHYEKQVITNQPGPQAKETEDFTSRITTPAKYVYAANASEEDTESHFAMQKLTLEKHIYFGLWLILSAYVCYVLVILITQGLFSIELEIYEVIYIAVFFSAVMVGVMWYTLYSQEAWIKWLFSILGCLVFVSQAVGFFIVFNTTSIVENLTFDQGYSGLVGAICAAVLTVGWTGWYIFILWRDAQRLQV